MHPQYFGKYTVLQLLGQGGMAAVYLARHPDLDREVAIKVIHTHLSAEAGFAERFRREARLLASLRHPHIVQLFDFDMTADQPFMVMEYLAGDTLKERLAVQRAQERPLSVDETLRLLMPLASALDYAHSHDLVHRDIKPANILFTAEGDPVLSDLGIAKMLSETAHLSMSGGIIGTPHYLSPEQAAGQPVVVHSDIYSFGVVVYEMVTGRVPFQGDTPTTVLLQHLNTPPPPPTQSNLDLHPPVQDAILRALAKRPEDRFASAEAFVHALQTATQSRSVAFASPDIASEAATVVQNERPAANSDALERSTGENRGRSRVRQYRLPAAFVVVLAFAGLLFALRTGWLPPRTNAVATEALLYTSLDGQEDIISPVTLCADPQPPLVTDLQVRQAPSLPEPQARVSFRDPVFGTCLVRVTDRTTDLTPLDPSEGLKNEYSRVQSFNADESRILVRSTEENWYLYDAATLQPLGQLPFDGSVEPRWDASDPLLLYYFDEARLMSYNLRTEAQIQVHDFAADFPGQPLAAVSTHYEGSPSRDGRYWGLMAQDQEWQDFALLVYDQSTDRVIAVRNLPDRSEINSITISPLGNYFLAYYNNYCQLGQLGSDADPCGLMVYDRNLSNGRGLLRVVEYSDLALDAQGREALVYQGVDTDNIYLLDLATGTVTRLWPIDFSHTAIGLHFSGRAFNRPGWALVSTYNGGHPTDYTWMDDQVFAVELKRNGRVVRLAHTRSLYNEDEEQDYWAEPHASVNRDFTRVVFTTNWGRSGTGQIEMFLIELPPDWLARLP